MRLRSRDTNYNDESARALGLANFLGDLKSFLDERIEGDGDDWAPVSDEDEDKLYGLIKELIALKWGTDADGDLPINFALADRNHGYLNEFIIPYDINEEKLREQGLSEDEIEEKKELYWMDLARTAGHMASSAKELMNRFDHHFADKLVKRQEARERQKLLEQTLEMINSRSDESNYEADRDLIILMTKPRAYDAKHKEAGKLNNDETAQKALQAAMVVKYPKRLERAIEEIAKLMEPFEDDDSEGYYNEVTKPRLVFVRVFGDVFTHHPKIGPVAQGQYQKGKAKRNARRASATAAKTAAVTPTTV